MAEVKHQYVEQNTAQATTSSGWNDVTGAVIDGADLDASTKYLAICRLLMLGDPTDKGGVRLYSADDSALEDITAGYYEAASSISSVPLLLVSSFTTAATPTDVKLQFGIDASDMIVVYEISILLIDLDDLGSGNYVEASGDHAAELGTGGVGKANKVEIASLTGSDLGTTDEWLVLGMFNWDVDSTSASSGGMLWTAQDASSATEVDGWYEEGEDFGEVRTNSLVGRHKAVTSNVDATMYAYQEANYAMGQINNYYLVAVNTAAFTDFEYDYSATGSGYTGTETTYATVGPYTPSTNGNHLILGRAGKTTTSSEFTTFHLEDGTTATRSGDENKKVADSWDSTDILHGTTLERISISAAKTYNLRAKIPSGTATESHAGLFVLNLNLAGGGTAHEEEPTDDVGATDTTSPALEAARTVTDAAGVTDSTSRIATFVRTITDAAGLTDSVSDDEHNREAATSPVGVTDTVGAVRALVRTVTDTLGITDATNALESGGTDYTEAVTDAVGITDTVGVTGDPTSPRVTLGTALNTALGDGYQVYTSPPSTIAPPAVVIRPADPYQAPVHAGGTAGSAWAFDLDLIVRYNLSSESADDLEELFEAVVQALPAGWRWVEFGEVGELRVASKVYLKGTLGVAMAMSGAM